ncbi:discoidin domain-containing protein [Cellulosimicrobium cellulans]|uniref:discoidin domain-containing protein n=1 Tax=Cellulosimicrobium cellulans TaxID=1710 RepID=UPI0028B1F61B|nr:discoidin domain-containing protein [Cellulosimicrobium cellulans]
MHLRPTARLRLASLAAGLTAACVAAPLVAAAAPVATAAEPVNLSQGKPATASSVQGDYAAARAVDGDLNTRWGSEFAEGQWLQVDLGQISTLSSVALSWEGAYGKGFRIEASDDGTTWRTLRTVTDGTGGQQTLPVSGTGRYVRLLGTERGTGYGYSLWELQVFGTPGTDGGTVDPGGPGGPGADCTTNAALGKAATASSAEGAYAAGLAVDGKADTRWSSEFSDAQWLQVDLGSIQPVCGIEIDWEGAYGKGFRVESSDDGTLWRTLRTVTDGTGGKQVLDVTGSGRYVRLVGTERGTGWGYSIWELRVLTTGDGTNPGTGEPIEGGGDLGPNVHVFGPGTPVDQIQAAVDAAYAAQEESQFGLRRDQFLFEPGTYPVHVNVGFNTAVNGLGKNPDDVNITGGVWADAEWFEGNATQNFWRSIENLAVTPTGGDMRWAVSQAAPMRRIHVKGNLMLHSSRYGWASGGFTADSVVDGQVRGYTQQQWYTRDSTLTGGWDGTLWNMVFSGTENAPPTTFPEPAVTTLDTTGTVREKPYLYLDGDDYAVFVPSLREGTRGATWKNGSTPGTSIPLDDFYVAHPGDTAEHINAALDQGLNLLLTPGVYQLDETIEVNRADTVVLGLGYATIVPTAGQTALQVGDVDGVRVASVLFDAGAAESPSMLTVGTDGSSADHADDPISIHDVFVRVGGAHAGKVDSAIVINADDTIVDHIWSWRGDHGEGIGWDVNTADHGLVVNGDDVDGYGLFVEHYQKYNTLWNGERGRTIFYQNELPYDPPNQAAWNHDGIRGWAAYKVADHVRNHEAWGLGSYCVFTSDASIVSDNGFEVPITPGVRMHSLLTVSLGGVGTYEHVINGVGPRASGVETVPAKVVSYP